MKYEILGDDLQACILDLDPGEFVQAESGTMFFIEGNISMDSRVPGGWVGGLKRMFLGESFVMPIFKAKETSGRVAFAAPFPGKILELEVQEGKIWQAQKNSFLFAYGDVKINISLVKKFKAGFFGGEGFILQKFTGNGKVFIHCGGLAYEKTLAPNETVKIDSGCVVAFEETVTYDVQAVQNLKTAFFGGEGLFLTTLTGPGKIILQSLPLSRLRTVLFTGGSKSGVLSDVGNVLGGA